MLIAPGIDAAEWQALKLDDPHSPDWDRAIVIFEARIQGRFVDPVDLLISSEDSKVASEKRFGFAILAIDCLLVETLDAFREGLKDTRGKSETAFCRFLTYRPTFANHFDKKRANRFYEDVRCTILHQAEITEGRVWSVGPLVQEKDGEIIVNRTEFHRALKAEFENYLAELRSPKEAKLRGNFRKKMNYICGAPDHGRGRG